MIRKLKFEIHTDTRITTKKKKKFFFFNSKESHLFATFTTFPNVNSILLNEFDEFDEFQRIVLNEGRKIKRMNKARSLMRTMKRCLRACDHYSDDCNCLTTKECRPL